MRLELLKKLKGQRVELEYGHPYRPSPSSFYGFIFDVIGSAGKEIVVFLVQRSSMIAQALQPAQPGVAVSQSNMAQIPTTERIAEYVILFLEPEGIIAAQIMSTVQYRFNPQTVAEQGARFLRREADTLYTERHLNWEQFERMLNEEIRKQIKNLDWSDKITLGPTINFSAGASTGPGELAEAKIVPVTEIVEEPVGEKT